MRFLSLVLAFVGVSLGAQSENLRQDPSFTPDPFAEVDALKREKKRGDRLQGAKPSTLDTTEAGVSGSAVPDYIRYEEREDGSSSLQTAITRFKKGKSRVDLVSVVHLGDQAYYEFLSEKLSGYDKVLYEMVGGAFQKGATSQPVRGDDADPIAAGLRQVQGMASSILGLEFQLDSIDYEAPNFVHADVTWDQYHGLMTAKNENFSTFFMRALSLSEEEPIPGLPQGEAGTQAMMQQMLGAVMSGDSSELKRMMAPFLAESESLISKLEGEEGTVLVTERNKVVMKKLGELEDDGEKTRYAIFYGGGHMPDLETRLLADGYSKKKTEWVDAWEIPNPDSAVARSSRDANPLGMLMKVLSENPEIGSMLRDFGSSLNDSRSGTGFDEDLSKEFFEKEMPE